MKKSLLLFSLVLLFGYSHAQQQLNKEKVEALDYMVTQKLMKFDLTLDKAWISPKLWQEYNIDEKAKITELSALYVRYKTGNRSTDAALDLYDYQSGKRIASYGLLGFRIID